MEGVIGVVTCYAGPTIPSNWLACNGQQLQITSIYQPLFAVIGNAFGGDGESTFNLPDLRGRVPVSPGISVGHQYQYAKPDGAETITLQPGQLPLHTHSGTMTAVLQANIHDGVDASSENGYPSRFTGAYAAADTANCSMNAPATFPQVLPTTN